MTNMKVFAMASVAVLLASLGVTGAAVPYWEGNVTQINVCTSEYSPMVYCVDRDPEGYSGYEIELFRKVSRVLGWEPEMLNWSCLPWEEMVESLASGDGKCDIAVAGVEIIPENLDQGIVFSRPTFRNGLTVLVKNTQKTSSVWAFWDAFEWQLWVIAIFTAVGVSILVWAIDNFYYRYGIERLAAKDKLDVQSEKEREADAALDYGHKFERYYWEAIMRPMMNRDFRAYTVAGNIVTIAFGFLLLILYTLYLGNTAANLTILALDTNGISSINDLAGKPVATWTGYSEQLAQKYRIVPVALPWDTTADEEALFAALKEGTAKALVLDTPFMEYVAATDCDISVVGGSFDQFDVGVAFAKGFNNTALLTKYNDILITLSDSGEDEQLVNTYITPPESECGELYSSAVTLKQVAGLWILFAICIAIALAWLAITKMFENSPTGRKIKKFCGYEHTNENVDAAAGLNALKEEMKEVVSGE